jgi:hypothetical protein
VIAPSGNMEASTGDIDAPMKHRKSGEFVDIEVSGIRVHGCSAHERSLVWGEGVIAWVRGRRRGNVSV